MVVFPYVLSCFLSCIYSIHYLSSPFLTISRRFVFRARVGDDTFDFSGLLFALATLDALCWIMSVMVSMVSIPSSPYSVSNRFLNSSWNSIFCDPIRVASSLDGLLVIIFPLLLYVQFDDTHNHSVVSFNVDLVDDCYVCDDVWPICWDVFNFGLRFTVWAFPRPSPPYFLLKHGIHDFVLSRCCPFCQGVASFVSQFEPKCARCRFHRVCSFP